MKKSIFCWIGFHNWTKKKVRNVWATDFRGEGVIEYNRHCRKCNKVQQWKEKVK